MSEPVNKAETGFESKIKADGNLELIRNSTPEAATTSGPH